ncbi:response regulator [Lysobacter capsici]|uniref:response regulator n=1 Tax=Lysobacter capsici TaxID=435897 RepID=UPI001C00747E|nr:response regulator [Lysobacter capsici]MBW8810326.1 response regulator [Lysobacter sp.]QWF16322.1 response regulator [Lysobacter capsici]
MTWRLLFVDDVAEDVELATLELGRWPAAWVSRRVDNEPQLRAALAEFAPDIVLCDLNLPGFDGEAARAIVRAQAPASLFVFLTGATADATEHLDETVWDKNRLELLPMQLQALIDERGQRTPRHADLDRSQAERADTDSPRAPGR